MPSEPIPEPKPVGLAPWEPWAWYGTYVALAVGLGLRALQWDTRAHGIRLLASVLMLMVASFLVVESALVLGNVRGALEKISGRPPDDQLTLMERYGSGQRGASPRVWSCFFVLISVMLIVYGIQGL